MTSVQALCVLLSSYTRGGGFSTAPMHTGLVAFQSLLTDVYSTNISYEGPESCPRYSDSSGVEFPSDCPVIILMSV